LERIDENVVSAADEAGEALPNDRGRRRTGSSNRLLVIELLALALAANVGDEPGVL